MTIWEGGFTCVVKSKSYGLGWVDYGRLTSCPWAIWFRISHVWFAIFASFTSLCHISKWLHMSQSTLYFVGDLWLVLARLASGWNCKWNPSLMERSNQLNHCNLATCSGAVAAWETRPEFAREKRYFAAIRCVKNRGVDMTTNCIRTNGGGKVRLIIPSPNAKVAFSLSSSEVCQEMSRDSWSISNDLVSTVLASLRPHPIQITVALARSFAKNTLIDDVIDFVPNGLDSLKFCHVSVFRFQPMWFMNIVRLCSPDSPPRRRYCDRQNSIHNRLLRWSLQISHRTTGTRIPERGSFASTVNLA